EGPPREGRPTGAAVEAGEVDLGGTCLRAARARLVANNAPARVQRGSETGCGPGAGAPVAYGKGGSSAPRGSRHAGRPMRGHLVSGHAVDLAARAGGVAAGLRGAAAICRAYLS